jgi:hypothetical protein
MDKLRFEGWASELEVSFDPKEVTFYARNDFDGHSACHSLGADEVRQVCEALTKWLEERAGGQSDRLRTEPLPGEWQPD